MEIRSILMKKLSRLTHTTGCRKFLRINTPLQAQRLRDGGQILLVHPAA